MLCVVSRAREAEAERGKSGPGGGAGAAAIFCFGLSVEARRRGAGGELDDELPGRLERQADRPIGCLAPLDVLALQFWWPPAAGEPD